MPDFFAERTLTEAILVLVVFVLGMAAVAFVSFKVRTRYLLAAALILSVLQGFVPFSYISWFLLFGVSLLPVAIVRARRRDLGLWLWMIVAVAAIQSISVLWSPTIGAVAHAVLSTTVLATMFLLWSDEARRAPALTTSLLIASPAAALYAVLVWLFRISPSLEMTYLTSPLARFLSEPGVELISSERWLNVFDVAKSGAFMLNGNIASLYLLLFCVLYVWSFLREDGRARWILLGMGVLSFSAVFATGSKTPVFLVIAVPLLAVATLCLVRAVRLGLVVVGVGALLAVAALVVAASLGMVDDSINTLLARSAYWKLAALELPTHWLLGLGHGGWEVSLQENWAFLYGDLPFQGYPPHNFVLQAWADAGLIHAAAVVVLAIVPVVAVVSAMRRDRSQPIWSVTSLGDALLMIGLVWTPAHALTDTTTFFGDNHTIPVYAALVALAILRNRGEVPWVQRASSQRGVVSDRALR